ncbi:MAG: tRNA lysidine(34) synthetase TilS [Bacteroidales bacterium]|nr:tRNA lysidine(34) synthetase TilS [Bacteroidales bacterium]
MIEDFFDFIEKNELFTPTDKIILAISGGIDSVVMCELFNRACFSFSIAHCNFRLRGQESDEDEIFVKEIAKKLGVDFFCKKFDTKKHASDNGISIQMAAREIRYDWFNFLMLNNFPKYKYVANAHHLDDQTETFFINLLRGTGISGLHGINPKQGNIIRPLMFAGRKEILNFANDNNLSYREDSSNKSDKYLRNKIRHKLLPFFNELNPEFDNLIKKNIENLKETEEIYRNEISRQKKRIFKEKDGITYISISELIKLNPIRTYLFEFLKAFGFNISIVEDIITSINNISGKEFHSSTHRIIKDREYLIIKPLGITTKNLEYYFSQEETIVTKPIKLSFQKIENAQNIQLKLSKSIAMLDFEKLKFPICIRKWKKGDYFIPFGSNLKKKLSDFFIDNKFSILEKEEIWLLCSDDKIAWIIGQRIDNRFRISKNTNLILRIEVNI